MDIIRASDSDRQRLGQAMADAFRDHPFFRGAVPHVDRRQELIRWLQDRTVAYGLRYGHVFTDEQRSGASVWLKPDASRVTVFKMVRTGLVLAPFKMGWAVFRRFLRLSSQMEEVKKRHADGPHYVLLSVGVDPEMRGEGIGSALVKAGTDLADVAGVPCYVETMIERNLDWYKTLGFRVIEEAAVPDVGPMWALVRPPNA